MAAVVSLPPFLNMTRTQARRKRAMVKASRDHKALIYLLGNRCWWCGATWADAPLQVDHVKPRPPGENNRSPFIRGLRWDVRVKRYWAEFYAGVELVAGCRPCNEDRGRRHLHNQEDLEPAPF